MGDQQGGEAEFRAEIFGIGGEVLEGGGALLEQRAIPRPLGGAGLFSTAEDVAKFYQMTLNGGRAPEFDEATAHAYIGQTEFSISIQLHQGTGSCVFWTTDLTHEYIRINADYST